MPPSFDDPRELPCVVKCVRESVRMRIAWWCEVEQRVRGGVVSELGFPPFSTLFSTPDLSTFSEAA